MRTTFQRMRATAKGMCAAGLGLWLSGSSVQAQSSPGFTLQVHEHAGCVDAAALTAEVEARTGRPARAQSTAAALSVNVTIATTANGPRADIAFLDSERALVAEHGCAELQEMLAVVIASSLGIASQDPPESTEVPGATPAVGDTSHKRAPQRNDKVTWRIELPRAAAARSSQGRDPLDHAPSPPWQVDLDVSGRMLTGTMPQAAFGPSASLLAQRAALGLRVGATWLPGATYALQPLALHTTGGLGELGLCARATGESPLSALFCAELWAGAVRATADPLWRPEARWDALLLLVPRAQARLQLARAFGLALGLGAAIPLLFPHYAYSDAAAARIAAHAPELGVFLELALWLKIHS